MFQNETDCHRINFSPPSDDETDMKKTTPVTKTERTNEKKIKNQEKKSNFKQNISLKFFGRYWSIRSGRIKQYARAGSKFTKERTLNLNRF